MCFVSLAGGRDPIGNGLAEGGLSQRACVCIRIASVSAINCELLLADVSDEEDDGEHDAECAHDDVADGQEVVLSSEHVGRRKDECFLTLEAAHIVVVLDLDGVGAFLKVSVFRSTSSSFVRKAGAVVELAP